MSIRDQLLKSPEKLTRFVHNGVTYFVRQYKLRDLILIQDYMQTNGGLDALVRILVTGIVEEDGTPVFIDHTLMDGEDEKSVEERDRIQLENSQFIEKNFSYEDLDAVAHQVLVVNGIVQAKGEKKGEGS